MTFLTGLTMGLAYVAPIGLQNLFVINSAISQKPSRAYLTALIVVFFDVTLALACFFGIGAIMDRFDWLKLAILGVGAAIVIWIGISLLRDKSQMEHGSKAEDTVLKTIGSACVFTWFNPQALIDGTMFLGAFRVTLPPEESTLFILGVATASVLWFFGITTIITKIGDKISNKVLRIINIVCGTIVIFYGLKLAYSFFIMIRS